MIIDEFFIARLLVGKQALADISEAQWTKLILILRETKLLATLCHRIETDGLLDDVPAFARLHLISAKTYAHRQAKQVDFECAELVSKLKTRHIDVLFLKGAGYRIRGSVNSLGRLSSDIDVLCAKEDIPQAERELFNIGWEPDEVDDYDQKYYREWSHEIPPLIHRFRETVLDIHHNLYLPVSGRAPDISLFTQNNQSFDNKQVLGVIESVMHSIIHLYMNEDFTSAFRDLFDIYTLLKDVKSESEWRHFTELAEQSKFTFEVACCLNALEVFYDFKPPEYVTNCYQLSKLEKLWSQKLFILAIVPSHPSTMGWKNRLARNLVYLRGHFIKMPFNVLVFHLATKAFKGSRDKLMGKVDDDESRQKAL